MISISFIVTFVTLISVYAVIYVSIISPAIPVDHLPSSIPPYSSFWAKYVPADAVQFGLQNYTKIRLLNSTFPLQNTLLQLVKPVDVIRTSDVNYFLTVIFGSPNITIDFTFLNTQSYLNFQAPLQQEVGFGEQAGNATLYSVADNVNGQLVLGWLALIPGDQTVAFAAGTADAKQAISLSLQSAASPASVSILSRSDIVQSLYIIGGVADHIGVGGQNFPGVVRSGLMTVISVDSKGPFLYVTNVIAFGNSTAAMAHYLDVKHAYLGAQKFVVYDSFVMAQEQDGLNKLFGDYRLVL